MDDILKLRLKNQQLTDPVFRAPEEVVRKLCGIQAQDYGQAKWAIGIRAPGLTDEDIEHSLSERSIIRTWLFRGTLHFIAPEDAGWLLNLLASRSIQASRSRYKEFELDESLLFQTNDILARHLEGGACLTKEEISAKLAEHDIIAENIKLTFILQRAAFDRIICSGPRRDKEYTYTLLPLTDHSTVSKEEALGRLAIRYISGHGPATANDLAWWAGIPLGDARSGLASAGSVLSKTGIDDKVFWYSDQPSTPVPESDFTFLLPGFDEYILGYKDRNPFLEPAHSRFVMTSNGIFYPTILSKTKVTGVWKRIQNKNHVSVSVTSFTPDNNLRAQIAPALKTYETYLNKKILLDGL